MCALPQLCLLTDQAPIVDRYRGQREKRGSSIQSTSTTTTTTQSPYETASDLGPEECLMHVNVDGAADTAAGHFESGGLGSSAVPRCRSLVPASDSKTTDEVVIPGQGQKRRPRPLATLTPNGTSAQTTNADDEHTPKRQSKKEIVTVTLDEGPPSRWLSMSMSNVRAARESLAGSLMSDEEIMQVMSGRTSRVISTIVGSYQRSSSESNENTSRPRDRLTGAKLLAIEGKDHEKQEEEDEISDQEVVEEEEEETASIHTATRVSILSPSAQQQNYNRGISAYSFTLEGRTSSTEAIAPRSVGSMTSLAEEARSPLNSWVQMTAISSCCRHASDLSCGSDSVSDGRATKLLEDMLSSVEAEQQRATPSKPVNVTKNAIARQSFLLLPPNFFPHTPLPNRKRVSLKAVPPQCLPRRAVSRDVVRKRRSSIHLGPSKCRSKHATTARGSTALRVDHARTTRGKFWAPINPVYEDIIVRSAKDRKKPATSSPTCTLDSILQPNNDSARSHLDETTVVAQDLRAPQPVSSPRESTSSATSGTIVAKEDMVCDVPLSAIALGSAANIPSRATGQPAFQDTVAQGNIPRKTPLVSCIRTNRGPRLTTTTPATNLRFATPLKPPPRAPLPPVPPRRRCSTCDGSSDNSRHSCSDIDYTSASTSSNFSITDSCSRSCSCSCSNSSIGPDSGTCSCSVTGSCSSQCGACHPSISSASSTSPRRDSCSTCADSSLSCSPTVSEMCSTCSSFPSSPTQSTPRSCSPSSMSSSSVSSTTSFRCPRCHQARMTINDGQQTTFEMVVDPSVAREEDSDATPRASQFTSQAMCTIDVEPPTLPDLPAFSPFVIKSWCMSESPIFLKCPQASRAPVEELETDTSMYATYPSNLCTDAQPSSALSPLHRPMLTPSTAALKTPLTPQTPRKSLDLRYSHLVSPMPVNVFRTSIAVPALEKSVASTPDDLTNPSRKNNDRCVDLSEYIGAFKPESDFLVDSICAQRPPETSLHSPITVRQTLAPSSSLTTISSSLPSSSSSSQNRQQQHHHQTLPPLSTLNRQVRLQELRRRRNEKRLDALAKLEGSSNTNHGKRQSTFNTPRKGASGGRNDSCSELSSTTRKTLGAPVLKVRNPDPPTPGPCCGNVNMETGSRAGSPKMNSRHAQDDCGHGTRADMKRKLLGGFSKFESMLSERGLTRTTTTSNIAASDEFPTTNAAHILQQRRQEAIDTFASGSSAGFDFGLLPIMATSSGEEAILRSHLRALDQAKRARSYARSQFIDQ